MKTLNKSVLLFAITSTSISVQAQNFFPNNSAELQADLITAAGNVEADTITLGAHAYTTLGNAGVFTIPKMENATGSLTITGAGEGITILQGDDTSAIVTLANTVNDYQLGITPLVIIEDLTVTGGKADSALSFIGADVELTRVELTANVSDDGAIVAHSIVAVDVNVHDNQGINVGTFGGWGAGLNSWFSMTVSDSTFTNNSKAWAGAAISNHSNSGGFTIISNSTFTNNSSTFSGGAVHSISDGDLTITDSVFTDNLVGNGLGGAVLSRDQGTITVTNSTFTNNEVGGHYGEFCSADQLERNFCAGDGGAIFVDDWYGAEISINGSTFTENTAFGAGGAIGIDGTCSQGYPNPDSLNTDAVAECVERAGQTTVISYTVTDSVFTDNTAGYRGDAIWTSEGASLKPDTYTYGEITFTNSRFINNDVDSVSGLNSVVVEVVERETPTTPTEEVTPVAETTAEPTAAPAAGGSGGGGSMSFLMLSMLAGMGLLRKSK